MRIRRQRGAILLLRASSPWRSRSASPARWRSPGGRGTRERASERALAEAREALIAYAADRPIDAARRPRLPALPRPRRRRLGRGDVRLAHRATSGQASASGACRGRRSACPDLRDGYGERLWYAVSTQAQGTAQLRGEPRVRRHDAATRRSARSPCATRRGALIHDGTLADPMPRERRRRGGGGDRARARRSRAHRRTRAGDATRGCAAPRDCRACDPRELSRQGAGARLATRTTPTSSTATMPPAARSTRTASSQGPVRSPTARIAVNDRIAVIAYRDVMPRVMQRVALEVAACCALRARNAAASGTAACLRDATGGRDASARDRRRVRRAGATRAADARACRRTRPAWWARMEAARASTRWTCSPSPARARASVDDARAASSSRATSGRRFAVASSTSSGARTDRADASTLECERAPGCTPRARSPAARERAAPAAMPLVADRA